MNSVLVAYKMTNSKIVEAKPALSRQLGPSGIGGPFGAHHLLDYFIEQAGAENNNQK